MRRGGIRYRGGAGNGPIAGEYCNVHLKNPAGSGRVAFVYRLRMDNVPLATSVDGAVLWGYYNVDLVGGAYVARSPMDQRQSGTSVCLIAANSDPNVLVIPAQYLDRSALPLSADIVDSRADGEEIAILTPGTGLLIHTTFQSVDLDAAFDWEEHRE